MFDGAVEAGIQAFLAGGGDDEVGDRLENQGVEPWLVERLRMFLPIAYGRVILRDCRHDPNFIDGDVTRPLDGDPVYRAAAERAQRANRAEIEAIGLRSAAVNAANQLLHKGSRMEDLEFVADRQTSPLPPAQPGDGGVPSPRDAFAFALREHGFEVDSALRTGQIAIDARLFPWEVSERGIILQIDFSVSHPRLAKQWLIESVAGYSGTWRKAIGAAVATFAQGSLHPIMAVLLDPTAGADQVQWEEYPHPAGRFMLCHGPFLNLYGGPTAAEGPFLDELLERLRSVPLTPAIHWLRAFISTRDGRLAKSEVLLDNEEWREGEQILARHAVGTGHANSRLFLMLVPA